MRKRPPKEIGPVLERLRDHTNLPAGADSLFDLVLELVEYVASREDLVRARERDLEPDSLARRVLTGAESTGLKAVRSILSGVAPSDLATLEEVLLTLERQHGTALETPPNHRLLVDGAVLGDVGFVYNRKFREVLAIRAILDGSAEPDLLPGLTRRVDEVFAAGRPRYLWRLGPEFGIDRNVRHLTERGDDFIVRSLYRSRARRLARQVLRWQELPTGEWIGENCEEAKFARPVRHLLIRTEKDGRTEYGLMLSSLLNTPWEDIYRFYRNRSGKWASMVEVVGAQGPSLRRKIEVAVLILALFTFRNLRTWAASNSSQIREEITISAEMLEKQRMVALFESRVRAESLERFRQVVAYYQQLTDSGAQLEGVEGTLKPPCYRVSFDEAKAIPALADGRVMFVDADGTGGAGKSVVLFHGEGFSTAYSHLATLADEIRLGAEVTAGQQLGSSGAGDAGAMQLEARLAKRYAEKGFEPTASEVLAPEASFAMDPFGVLVELDSQRVNGERADKVPPAHAPDLDDADLFTLTGDPLPVDILFVTARGAEMEYEEPIIAEALDADLGFASVLGEDIDDIS